MLANATYCIGLLLVDEGGYVNNPEDNGGPTNLGITLDVFRRYIKPKATIDDIKKLTRVQAIDVYKQQFWNAVRADELMSGVDYAVFDFAVNSGPSRAIKLLQHVVGVAPDGRFGPKTLAAIDTLGASTVINRLCDARMDYLRGLHDWPTFGNGWTKRVSGVRADAIAMISLTTPKPVKKQTLLEWFISLFHRS